MSIARSSITVPEVAEAKATLMALQIVVSRSFVPVESDAKILVECILQQVLLSALHHGIFVAWIPRSVNMAAHEFCQWASCCS